MEPEANDRDWMIQRVDPITVRTVSLAGARWGRSAVQRKDSVPGRQACRTKTDGGCLLLPNSCQVP